MPDQKNDVRSLPSRQVLLAADKEELVERIEALQADLQRRMEVEEEILHLNLQKGTASLQTQVEEASRRFKNAQQELEAFRLEILREEGDPAGQAPRPYIYEDLTAPPQEGPDRSQLRSLLNAFRRLRDERDRLKQELERTAERGDEAQREKARAEKAAAEIATLGAAVAEFEAAQARLRKEIDDVRAEADRLRSEPPQETPAPVQTADEVSALKESLSDLQSERDEFEREAAIARGVAEQLRQELETARADQSRADDDAGALRSAKALLEGDVDRLGQENARLQAESSAQVEEQAQLGRKIAYEQAKSEQLGVEARRLVARLAETARMLEEARYELEHPEQREGFDQLEKFFQKARLKPLLEKHVKGPQRKDMAPAAELLFEFVGATIGAQAQPLEAARNLTPRIIRPSRRPGLGELRQFVEVLTASEGSGAERVHDALRASFFPTAKRQDALTIDVDTLELVVARDPLAAQSYWPLVLFVPELQEFWHGALRPAPDSGPKEIAQFLAEGLSRAPSSLDKSRLRFRMDARFYGEAVVKLLEAKKCSYVIVPPDSADLRAAARACAFGALADGWEAGEWLQRGRSARAPLARFVVLRHARTAQPSPTLPFLFRDPQHVYHVFAVDRKISAQQALASYAAREAAEEREHALLRDFCVNRMMARGPESHAAFFPLFLLCADLVQWYRRGIR